MQKKLAILVRDRQDEAVRMAAGLILADDAVNLFVLDRKLEPTEANTMNVDLLKDMDQAVYERSRHRGEGAPLERGDRRAAPRVRQHPGLLTGADAEANGVKILHLQKRDLSPTEKAILEAHRGGHEVAVIDLRTEKDYGRIVDQIFAADKVVSW